MDSKLIALEIELILTDDPIQRDGKTYCTVMTNGSYDIEIKSESSGAVVATLERVCINYSETLEPPDAPKYPGKHSLDALYIARVKSSSKKCFISFETEFFQAVSPTLSLFKGLNSPNVTFACTSGPAWDLKADAHKDFQPPTDPRILPLAANRGMLYITGTHQDC